MAGGYILPQVRVFQDFLETPNSVTQALHPFVFGPQYQLMRYSAEDERTDCATGEYDGATGVAIAWSRAGITGSTVDVDYTKVTFTDIKAKIPVKDGVSALAVNGDEAPGTFNATGVADGSEVTIGETTFYSRIEIKETSISPTDSLAKDVAVGDYVGYETTDGDSDTVVKYSRIRALSVGTLGEDEVTRTVTKNGTEDNGITADVDKYFGGVSGKITVNVKAVNGKRVVEWSSPTITAVNGRKELEALDVASVPQSDPIDIGSGITITLGASDVDTDKKKLTGGTYGQYVVTLKVTDAAVVDTVVLDDAIPVGSGTVKIFFATALPDQEIERKLSTWTATADDGVRVYGDLTLKSGGIDYHVQSATVYVTQRNLVASHTSVISSLSSVSDIVAELGPITPDNPLAYGVYCAATNTAGVQIYYMGTAGTDLASYMKVLDRASLTSDIYAFCPLSDDTSVIDAVLSHVNAMSSAENKQWRIAFFSLPYSSEADVTPVHPDGSAAVCTIDTVTRKLTCVADGTGPDTYARLSEYVAVNDVVKIPTGEIDDYGAPVYYTLTVERVDSNISLTVKSDAAWAAFAEKHEQPFTGTYSLIHARTQDEAAEAIADASSRLYDHRAYNVFPMTAYSAGVAVPGPFIAAAVAGLACSVQPQQPITNVELKGFDDIPLSYMAFSREQLNTIAAGGTLIVMQDRPGSTVYIRHQLSTKRRAGNLNTTELSLVKNLDSISYYLSGLFTPYIGRYNVTDELVRILYNVLDQGITYLETSTDTNSLIGPQVIADGTKIVSLEQSATNRDTVYANVNLVLPTPFNNFDLHLLVI